MLQVVQSSTFKYFTDLFLEDLSMVCIYQSGFSEYLIVMFFKVRKDLSVVCVHHSSSFGYIVVTLFILNFKLKEHTSCFVVVLPKSVELKHHKLKYFTIFIML